MIGGKVVRLPTAAIKGIVIRGRLEAAPARSSPQSLAKADWSVTNDYRLTTSILIRSRNALTPSEGLSGTDSIETESSVSDQEFKIY